MRPPISPSNSTLTFGSTSRPLTAIRPDTALQKLFRSAHSRPAKKRALARWLTLRWCRGRIRRLNGAVDDHMRSFFFQLNCVSLEVPNPESTSRRRRWAGGYLLRVNDMHCRMTHFQ